LATCYFVHICYVNIRSISSQKKEGCQGHLYCVMCEEGTKNVDHLFTVCEVIRELWVQAASQMRMNEDREGGITTMIQRWLVTAFENKILNTMWTLVPEFVLCNVWKDRNGRILPLIIALKELRGTCKKQLVQGSGTQKIKRYRPMSNASWKRGGSN
jgi:hypothetical protein